MAGSISAADRTGLDNVTPIKRDPIDSPVVPLPVEPSFPYVVPTAIRESFTYQGEEYELRYENDNVLVRITNVDTSQNGLNQFWPIAIFSKNNGEYSQCLVISVNGYGQLDVDAMVTDFEYPVIPDATETYMSGQNKDLNLPPDFFNSLPSYIWNFKVTLVSVDRNNDRRDWKLEVWRDGDTGNKGTTTFSESSIAGETAESTAISVIVGNPEGFMNPYIQGLIYPTQATIQSVAFTFGRDVPITNMVYGDGTALHVNFDTKYVVDSNWVYPDPDPYMAPVGGGGKYTFTLVAGTGDTDNGLFGFNGNMLVYSGPDVTKLCSVRVKVEDEFAQTFEKVFSIQYTQA